MASSTRVVLEAIADGFSRLAELAPGAPEIDTKVNDDASSDWSLVGDDLWTAISEHPDLGQRGPVDPHAKELVEA